MLTLLNRKQKELQPDIILHPEPVRWGVLSVANIGVKRVIPAILASSNGQFMAVASRNPHRARELFAHMPQVRIYGAYESLLEDPEKEPKIILPPKPKVTLRDLACKRCGGSWTPQRNNPPIQCPKCKSPYLNRERRNT